MKLDRKEFIKRIDQIRSKDDYSSARFLEELKKLVKERYLDKESLSVLKESIDSTHRGSIGQYTTPQPIVDLMVALAPIKEGDIILDPTCGTGSYLLEASGKAKNLKLFGVDVNPLIIKWAEFLTDAAGIKAKLINQNSLMGLEGIPKADVLFANIPWGLRVDEKISSKFKMPMSVGEGLFLQKFVDMVKVNGWILAVVPDGVLYKTSLEKLREYLFRHTQLKAVISLPSKSFRPYSGIKTSIIILKKALRETKPLTYMVEVNDLEKQLDLIIKEFGKLDEGKNISLGFVVDEYKDRWDVSYYNYIKDFSKFEKVSLLKDIAGVTTYKGSMREGDFVITQFGKVLEKGLGEESKSKRILVSARLSSVFPKYLYSYLNSELGSNQVKSANLGSTIPYITISSIENIRVPLPSLKEQQQIVSSFVSKNLNLSILKSFIGDAEDNVIKNIFDIKKSEIELKLEKVVSVLDQFPHPISNLQAQVRNESNYTRKINLIFNLFEVIFRYVGIINLIDLEKNFKLDSFKDVARPSELSKPTLGQWKIIFERSIEKLKQVTKKEGDPFFKELKDLDIKNLKSLIVDVVRVRNEKVAHATVSEYECQELCNRFIPVLDDLLKVLNFIRKYELIRVESLDKRGDNLDISVKLLMGESNQFEKKEIPIQTLLDTKAVHLRNERNEFLNLNPLVLCETCLECHREEVLVYDKNHKDLMSYLGFESGHHTEKVVHSSNFPAFLRS